MFYFGLFRAPKIRVRWVTRTTAIFISDIRYQMVTSISDFTHQKLPNRCLKGKICRRTKNGSPGFARVSDKESDFNCTYYLYVIKISLGEPF
jgi:hypothetical protein